MSRWLVVLPFAVFACDSELAYVPAAPTASQPTLTCESASCPLDATMENALAGGAAQTIILGPGTYSLNTPITGAISFVAADQASVESTASASQALSSVLTPCTASSTFPATPTTPSVRIEGAGTQGVAIASKDSGARITFTGIAISGGNEGALTVTSGTAAISRSTLSGSLVVSGPNARASVDGAVISSNLSAVAADPSSPKRQKNDLYVSSVACHRAGIKVVDGAEYVGSNVEIRGAQERGICVHASSALLCNGTIHGTLQSSDAKFGRGAEVLGGGALTLRGTRVYDNFETGILASDFSTAVTLADRVEIDSNKRSTQLATAVGIVAQEQATLTATDLTVHNNDGLGVFIETAALASLESVTISQNKGAGLALYDGKATLATTTIDHTSGDSSLDLGVGILTMRQSTLSVVGSTVTANRYAGAWLAGATGRIDISSSTFSEHAKVSLGATSVSGNGIYASGRCSDLSLRANTFSGNEGPHIFLNGAYATLAASTFSANGLEFVSQDCTCPASYTVGELEGLGLPDATTTVELCPASDRLVPPLTFGMYLSEAEAL